MISATAADLKQQLADAIRMLARAEIVDHSGHGSARRDSASFYINSAASARGTLTADDIVAVDLDVNLIEGSSRPPLEFHILPGALRVRIPRGAPGLSPAAAAARPGWSTIAAVLQTAAGRPVVLEH